jgi:hypothetical protein
MPREVQCTFNTVVYGPEAQLHIGFTENSLWAKMAQHFSSPPAKKREEISALSVESAGSFPKKPIHGMKLISPTC